MSRTPCIHDLFLEQVARTPDVLAVVGEDRSLTYRELERESRDLAGLFQEHGVGRDRAVGVLMEKSVDYVVACFAALRAGGAYLPLDTAYPEALLSKVLRQVRAPVVATHRAYRSRLMDCPVENVLVMDGDEGWGGHELDEDAARVGLDDLAYVVYSSGTTGEPKGIEAPHRGAVHSYDERHRFRPYRVGDRVACNVFFVWEFFRPLLRGGTVHVIPDGTIYDPRLLTDFLAEHAITEVLFTPSLLSTVLGTVDDAGISRAFSSVRTLWLNGEVVTSRLRRKALERLPAGTALLNTYSISECHDVASMDLRSLDEAASAFCPVGAPIPGVVVRFLDEERHDVPEGEVGELYVGGPCLARGYLRRPDLTATRFVELGGERFYRTGDLARRLPDGNLEVRGRCDFMVKIRGYSVHLGAIESALASLTGVQACALIAEGAEGSDKRLVAYVVRDEGAEWEIHPGTGRCTWLRRRLEPLLAAYMLPSVFVEIDSVPLSPTTGKLLLSELPSPPPRAGSAGALDVRVAPDASEEERLQAMRLLWARILGLPEEEIGEGDGFFELGGHSLLAVDLSVAIERGFGRRLSVQEIYQHPTLHGLVAALGEEAAGARARPDLRAEAHLPEEITPASEAEELTLDEARDVFLTGATGFLGAFLLDELLRETDEKVRVHCLVRAPDGVIGRRRIRENLERYGLWRPDIGSRLQVIVGDLSLPRLGLGEEVFEALAGEVDFLFHCGALVNFVYPYGLMKGHTVDGTREVLRLASLGAPKPLYYLSTNGIFPGGGSYPETGEIDAYADQVEGGYGQSKWVAERLVWAAMERGLPACLFRPGNLGHHSETGAANPADLQYQLLEAFLKLGSAPDVARWSFELTPIDFLVRMLVRFARDPDHLGRVYNVVEPRPLDARELLDHWIAQRHLEGYASRVDWLARLRDESATREDPALALLAETMEQVERYLFDESVYECEGFEAAARAAGIPRPTLGPEYLEPFLSRRR